MHREARLELSGEELREQMRRATELAGQGGPPARTAQALRDVIREARGKLRGEGSDTQQTTGSPPNAAAGPGATQAAAQPAQVDPELERKALAILTDKVGRHAP